MKCIKKDDLKCYKYCQDIDIVFHVRGGAKVSVNLVRGIFDISGIVHNL